MTWSLALKIGHFIGRTVFALPQVLLQQCISGRNLLSLDSYGGSRDGKEKNEIMPQTIHIFTVYKG